MDVTKIEEKIDRAAAGATEIDMALGGVRFQSMMELMEFSKLMAVSGAAVPVHLRGNPGACLAVCTRALRFGFDPFSLAEHSYTMAKNQKNDAGQWEKLETIAYDSFVIRAIINAHANLTGRIDYRYEGEGDERVCIAFATPPGSATPLEHRSPPLGKLKEMRGRNDKGQIKGSQLWDSAKSDQQLAYDTGRDFCRKYFPEILLGWYDKEEFDEAAAAAVAKDVTPAKGLKERLAAGKKAGAPGFDRAAVERQLEHKPGETLPDASPDTKDPVPVETKTEDEPSLAISAGDIQTEVADKVRAIQNADSIEDVNALLDSAKAFLKEHKRQDLLAEVMSAANERHKKLGKSKAA